MQRSKSQININGSIQSSKIVKSSNQGRAGIFVLILLTVLTLTWTLFIVLHIYDFQVHYNNDENIMRKLEKYNCTGEDSLQTDFPKLRYLSKLYIPSTLEIDLILWHTQLIVCAVKCKITV